MAKSIEDYIKEAAKLRGIDPNIAVRVAKSEGLAPGVWQSNVTKNGVREPSFGPFQLLVGGEGTGFPAGMGNDFIKQTGLDPRDPSTVYKQVDFALDNARKTGWSPWYGAAKVGINKWDGIGNSPGLTLTSNSVPPPTDMAPGTPAPPLENKGFVPEVPVAGIADAPAATAAAPDASFLDKLKGLSDDKDFTGGLKSIASALGGGSKSRQSADTNIMPSQALASSMASDASRMAAAQTMMTQLMDKRRAGRRVPGMSLMG